MSTREHMLNKADLERLSRFRLMDDDFMSKVFDGNIEATELILKIILERDNIRVISVSAQREFKTLVGHSVKFDIYAEDEKGKPYDIEIQRADKGASPRRARYNNSVLDTYSLAQGCDYSQLKETYVIFITENDILGRGCPIYHVERTIKETDELFNDGSHIIFVNGSYRNEKSEIGKLIHDFHCTRAQDMYYKELADKVYYFKETEGGNANMCKMMEDMRNEKAKDIAKKLIEENLPLETISRATELPLEELEKLKSNM